jgi:hypothetical protein
MRRSVTFVIIAVAILVTFFACSQPQIDDQFGYAQTRIDDLRLSSYITAGSVNRLLSTEEGRREALSLFRANGITKAYIEVYRGGLVVEKEILKTARDFFQNNNIDVVGGIATVPGKDFGVRQEAPLGWFNWQNEKTQTDLEKVVRMAAEIFDVFIVDDFLCTGDTSAESRSAKAERTWSQYRMDLLSELSTKLFIKPAKEVNPDITVIIKYPQWYDRFHLFGYDVEREPKLFDKVWVGTESRGQYTQRYGFVQPYEGFVNYRWLAAISGDKIGGAWFDHGDCDGNDFIEQAYQTVLAGAKEIVVFHYGALVQGHPGHQYLRRQFKQLADLAKAVAENPVTGVFGYKPPQSDAGGDLYIMDFIGMMGVPLVPTPEYPQNAKVVFLPTQAAADPEIFDKVQKTLNEKKTLVFTSGFLAKAAKGEQLAELAGLSWPMAPVKERTTPVAVEFDFDIFSAEVLLSINHFGQTIPLLTQKDNVFVLNTHTFSKADFDAVGEVLLCPRPLGMLEISQDWANTFRNAFNKQLNIELDAPTRIAVQPLGETGWVIHNYNQEVKEIEFAAEGLANVTNGFTGESVKLENGKLSLKPRSRIWLKK